MGDLDVAIHRGNCEKKTHTHTRLLATKQTHLQMYIIRKHRGKEREREKNVCICDVDIEARPM